MSQQPRIAAFVPMKGHSERVPGKNLRLLEGRPLYRWVVQQLLQVEAITTIVIDTDSKDIATDVASTFPSVVVVSRPHALRGDLVPMHDILVHDAGQVQEELLLQTHATNPLLTAATIREGIQAFLASSEHDSLMSVTAWRTRLFWPDGSPINHDPSILMRTQDLDPVYEENSCLYLFPREVLQARAMRVGARPLLFPIPPSEAVDVDEELDFVIAEALMARRQART